jgi:flagellar basal-body rod modification protein FlgD
MDNPIGFLPAGLESLGIDRQRETAPKAGTLQQEQFLELMLTQLRNQDPLKPMESGEFLGDLAQFGTVSGIGELQESFSMLAASLQSSQALQASTMVGRKVLVERDAVRLDDQTVIPLALDLPQPASQVRVLVNDALGQTVRQISLGEHDRGLVNFTWDGLDDGGARALSGTYTIQAQGLFNGVAEAVSTFIQAPVESVTLSRDGQPPVLNLTDIGAVDLGSIKRVL